MSRWEAARPLPPGSLGRMGSCGAGSPQPGCRTGATAEPGPAPLGESWRAHARRDAGAWVCVQTAARACGLAAAGLCLTPLPRLRAWRGAGGSPGHAPKTGLFVGRLSGFSSPWERAGALGRSFWRGSRAVACVASAEEESAAQHRPRAAGREAGGSVRCAGCLGPLLRGGRGGRERVGRVPGERRDRGAPEAGRSRSGPQPSQLRGNVSELSGSCVEYHGGAACN